MKINHILYEGYLADIKRVQSYLSAGRIPNRIITKGLAAEAQKAGSFTNFERDYLGQIKHGLYWHWTDDPNFFIDPQRGPRDMSSMADGSMDVGAFMMTSDLAFWSDYGSGGKGRPYVALIDMSAVPREAYKQVNRGFGNEFFVSDPSRARVLKVLTPKQAYRLDYEQRKWLPQSHAQLEQFYRLATGLTEMMVY